MKTLVVKRKITLSIFTVMLLICGLQGVSYSQEFPPIPISLGEIQTKGYEHNVPFITQGETNTSLKVNVIVVFQGDTHDTYKFQLRRQSPQGEWITKCIDINRFGSQHSVLWLKGFYRISAIFTDLDPGVTYEARVQDTNIPECVPHPPSPEPWSAIAEGTTRLVSLPSVEFVDANLARAVRRALNLDTQGGHIELLKIPRVELERLIHLEYDNKYNTPEQWKVIDLTGLEYATQLTTLSFSQNNIRDLTPLEQLTQLTELDLSSNNISDITPLEQLTQLTELDLSSNNISDITPLEQLTQLTELDLSSNNIRDLTPLEQLTQLTELDLSSNNIRDLTPLEQLTQLTGLYLSSNNISNLVPLTQLTNLKTLFLLINNIRDISPIAHLKQLTHLYLSYNQVRDVTPLAELTESLVYLDLSRNQVRDVTPLAQLIYLEDLKLTGNPITDTSPLSLLLDENPEVWIDIEVIRETPETETPETGGGLTITASTSSPLSAITLNGSVVTLTLSGGTFARSYAISNALTISGITGINFGVYENDRGWDENDISRISDTEIAFDLAYRGTINADTELIVSVGPDAIKNYNGPALTAEIPVSASSEAEVTGELIASTPFPLTRATLDGSYVKLTLNNKSFGYLDNEGVMVTTSGIPGIGIRQSETLNERKALVVKLSFKGNLDADATLTFIVPQTLIKDYNGPPLAATLSVTGKTGNQVLVSETSRPLMYWINTDTHKIESVEPFDAVTNQVRGLTVDAVGGKVYWSEQSGGGGTIKRANFNGIGVEQLASLPFVPTDIAINNITDELYWVNSLQGTIQSANLNGENIKTIIKRDDDIVDIVIDAEGSKLYWADQYSIWRVSLDGTQVETPLSGWGTKQTKGIGGMVVAEGKIYWTEHLRWGSTIGNIRRANLNGTNVETLAPPLGTPNGIAVDTAAGKVYWTNSLGGIQRTDINGGEVEAVVSGITVLEDFVLVPNVQETGPRPDLVIESVQAVPSTVAPGQTFRLYATLKNNGTGKSTATILRYYRSTNTVISTEDTQLGRARRDPLAPNGTIRRYLTVTAPITAGTYYYGACVDSVSNESDAANNCSVAVSITVTELSVVSKDVNEDGIVDAKDLVYVSERYGQTGATTADVNGNGVVNIDDLILVAAVLDADAAAAPSLYLDSLRQLSVLDVRQWLSEVRGRDLTDPNVQRGILFLEQLLAVLIPKETALLANYPNPFNPETWIPYRLAEDAFVTLTIYDSSGQVVRTLDVGHQRAAIYESRSKAIYWDGRNEFGEQVASGLYFYHLSASDYSATRRMVILK